MGSCCEKSMATSCEGSTGRACGLAALLVNFLSSFTIGVAYFAIGAYAYSELEGWAPLDTCYFLLVTITTVGYGEFRGRFERAYKCYAMALSSCLVIRTKRWVWPVTSSKCSNNPS